MQGVISLKAVILICYKHAPYWTAVWRHQELPAWAARFLGYSGDDICGTELIWSYGKSQSKVFAVHAIKAFRVSGGKAPLILNLGEVSGELHAPAALPPGRKAGAYWMECWVGARASLDVSEKNYRFLPCRNSNPGPFNQYPNPYTTDNTQPTFQVMEKEKCENWSRSVTRIKMVMVLAV